MLRKKEREHNVVLRKRIVRVALELFKKHGVKDVTMDDISATLAISKRTLYEVFEDKATLLLETVKLDQLNKKKKMDEIVHQSTNVLETILPVYEYSVKTMHQVNIKYFEDVRQYPKVKKMLDDTHIQEMSNVASFFRSGIGQGLFRPDIDFDIFSLILHNQLEVLSKMKFEKKVTFFDVLDFFLFTLLRGISTAKGLEIIENFIQNYRRYGENRN